MGCLAILNSSKLFRRRGSEFLCVLLVTDDRTGTCDAVVRMLLVAGARDRGRFSGPGVSKLHPPARHLVAHVVSTSISVPS